jgi:hypothetical protein
MMLARKPPVRTLDVVQRRAALHAKQNVKVHRLAHPFNGKLRIKK